MRNLSRPLEFILGPEDLNDIIKTPLWFVKEELDRRGIQVVKELKKDFPRISVDRSKMAQVFINLFMNAIEALPQGGQLTVRTYLPPSLMRKPLARSTEDFVFDLAKGFVVAEVEDNGSGIPQEILPRVFDPFVTTKQGREGKRGAGFSLVKNIMEMHRGEVDIENKYEIEEVVVGLPIDEGKKNFKQS